MHVYGSKPRPRVLLEDLPDPWAVAAEALFPSFLRVEARQSVEESEFDVVITAAEVVRRSPHLHVLALAPRSAGRHPYTPPSRPGPPAVLGTQAVPMYGRTRQDYASLQRTGTSLSAMLVIPEGASGTLRGLMEQTVVGEVGREAVKSTWRLVRSGGTVPQRLPLPATVDPLLLTGTGEVLAFSTDRYPEDLSARAGWMTVLPLVPKAPESWVRWFLRELRKRDSKLFPEDAAWREDPAWAPPELLRRLSQRADLESERRIVVAELDLRAAAADAAVLAEQAAADHGMWRLLTAQGGDLVKAARAAFEDLGFVVEDRDPLVAPGDPKLEDLRVVDREVPGWVCLVEVKGFVDGVSPKGVNQLTVRPVRAYALEAKRHPNALWYVANHDLATAPPQRPTALNRDPVIESFADHGGVFIDTRDLFTAWRAVQRGECPSKTARESLREGRGRWVVPTT